MEYRKAFHIVSRINKMSNDGHWLSMRVKNMVFENCNFVSNTIPLGYYCL